MTASEIIRQIEALPPEEQVKMRDWMQAHAFDESLEMLASLDAAAHSADTRGTTSVADARRSLQTWTTRSA